MSIVHQHDFRLWGLLAKTYEYEGWGIKSSKPNLGDNFTFALVIHHKDVDPNLNPIVADPLVLHFEPERQIENPPGEVAPCGVARYLARCEDGALHLARHQSRLNPATSSGRSRSCSAR
jgi:hypothetical protein